MEKYFRFASYGLYLISFFLPVFRGDDDSGFNAFVMGILTYPLAWSANIFYIVAIALKQKSKVEKLICSIFAIGVACTTFSIHELEGLGSESKPTKVSVGIGFYCWMGSFILFLISILVRKNMDKKIPEPGLPTQSI